MGASNAAWSCSTAREWRCPIASSPSPSGRGRRRARRRRMGHRGSVRGGAAAGDRTLTSTTGDWVVARWRADRSVVWVQTSPADKGARIERTTTTRAGIAGGGELHRQLQLDPGLPERGRHALFVAKLAAANGNVDLGQLHQRSAGLSCTAHAGDRRRGLSRDGFTRRADRRGRDLPGPARSWSNTTPTPAPTPHDPLDGAVLNFDIAPDALYALGDRLWKLQL